MSTAAAADVANQSCLQHQFVQVSHKALLMVVVLQPSILPLKSPQIEDPFDLSIAKEGAILEKSTANSLRKERLATMSTMLVTNPPVVADHFLERDAGPDGQKGHMADRQEEEPEAGPEHLAKNQCHTALQQVFMAP